VSDSPRTFLAGDEAAEEKGGQKRLVSSDQGQKILSENGDKKQEK